MSFEVESSSPTQSSSSPPITAKAFGEDDLVTHMFRERGAIEATHHVPLVVAVPPEIPVTQHVVDRRVSLAAIAATIYDLAGIDSAALRARFTDSPRSLAGLLGIVAHADSKLALPAPAGVDAEAKDELERRLRALGYIK